MVESHSPDSGAPVAAERLSLSDLAAAAGTGLGVAAFGSIIVRHTSIPLPLAVWWLFLILPVGALGGLLAASWLARYHPVFFQLAKFGLVGSFNTTIDLGVLNLLMAATGGYRGPLFALLKGASFVVAITNSYFWNRHWTFGRQQPGRESGGVRQYLLFVMLTVGGLALNVLVATLLVTFGPAPAGWRPVQWANFAAIGAVVATATWDFLCYKFIVFRPVRRR